MAGVAARWSGEGQESVGGSSTPHQISGEAMQRLIEDYTNKMKILDMHQNQSPTKSGPMISKKIQFYHPYQPIDDWTAHPEKQVRIDTLKNNVDNRQDGKVFLCRCLTTPKKWNWTSISTIVDDPKEKFAIRLVLFNFTSAIEEEHLSYVLPVGTIIAIKNPLFSLSVDERGNAEISLCVYSPEDVEIPNQEMKNRWATLLIDDSVNPLTQSKKYKTLGNIFFDKKNFYDAIRFFSSALNAIFPKASWYLYSRRAEAYLSFGCYAKAVTEIHRVLEREPFNRKGITITVKGYWGLRQYNEAVNFFNSKRNTLPELNKEAEMRKLIEAAEDMKEESTSGQYDVLKIYQTKNLYANPIAEYLGPVLIDYSELKMRGLKATKRIEIGQLIIVQKAFAFIEFSQHQLDVIARDKIIDPCHDELVGLIAQKLSTDIELCPEVYELYGGPNIKDEPVMGVDLQAIDKIVAINSFHSCISKPLSWGERSQLNATGVGLWTREISCLNHSCMANSVWNVIGDFFFLRATKTIERGESIQISYVDISKDYKTRAKSIQTHHDFTCYCELCDMDSQDDPNIHDNLTDILKQMREEATEILLSNEITVVLKDEIKGTDDKLLQDVDTEKYGNLFNQLGETLGGLVSETYQTNGRVRELLPKIQDRVDELLGEIGPCIFQLRKLVNDRPIRNHYIASDDICMVASCLRDSKDVVGLGDNVYGEVLSMGYEALKTTSWISKTVDAADFSMHILERLLDLGKPRDEVIQWIEKVKVDMAIAHGDKEMILVHYPGIFAKLEEQGYYNEAYK